MSRPLNLVVPFVVLVGSFVACDETLIAVAPLGGGGMGGTGGSGGDGGTLTSTTTVVPTTTTVTNMGGGCQGPTPVGALSNCSGSAVSATGGAFECFWCIEDTTGTEWQTDCVDGTCSCLLNGEALCTCSSSDFCGTRSCCGFPWNDPGE